MKVTDYYNSKFLVNILSERQLFRKKYKSRVTLFARQKRLVYI